MATVLVVDRTPALCAQMAATYRERGMQPITFTDKSEARSALQRADAIQTVCYFGMERTREQALTALRA